MRRLTSVVAMVARCRVVSLHVLTKDSATRLFGSNICWRKHFSLVVLSLEFYLLYVATLMPYVNRALF